MKTEKPFLVTNGALFEIHEYQFDDRGRREITICGPYKREKDALAAIERLIMRDEMHGQGLI